MPSNWAAEIRLLPTTRMRAKVSREAREVSQEREGLTQDGAVCVDVVVPAGLLPLPAGLAAVPGGEALAGIFDDGAATVALQGKSGEVSARALRT